MESYPIVSGITTKVLQYGSLDGKDQLVLVIPGNPGCVAFYREFMQTVHETSGLPVWGISHAGHSSIPAWASWEASNKEVFTLKGQIAHKVAFIRDHVPDHVRVILIGHSIGCYMILKAMNQFPEKKVSKGLLLFPTIERMAISPEGRRVTPILKYFRHLVVFLVFLLSLLPNFLKVFLTKKVLSYRTTKDYVLEGALNMVDPYCVSNVLFMANIEMRTVTDLDTSLVKSLEERLLFYYGATDHWCPVDYYRDMKARFPHKEDLYLCDKGYRHAFVLDSSIEIGVTVGDWIKSLVTVDNSS